MSREVAKSGWENADPESRFTVTAKIFKSVFDDETDITVTWSGTKAEIEQSAARYADEEMSGYPFLHMEIDTVEVLDE